MNARTELLGDGLRGCLALLSVYPNSTALQSIKAQIQYLIDLEKGLMVDRSRLANITIGVMTAREVEALDESVAETLYKVAAIAKEM